MSEFFTPESDPHLFKCPCNRPECDAPKPTEALLDALDRIRDYVDRPVIVTSGVRCEERNTSVGGEADSEHLTGRAADIYTPTSAEMYAIVEACYVIRVARIGVYRDKHVHIDVSASKPQHVMWVE